MRKLLKWLCTLIGITIFIFCIVTEVDGIGRFACILFGTIFSIIGAITK